MVCVDLTANVGNNNTHLFVTYVFWAVSGRFLHGCQAHHLEEMVLHDVTDYAKFVEISAPPLRAKRFFECDDDIRYIAPVPNGLENGIGKPEGNKTSQIRRNKLHD